MKLRLTAMLTILVIIVTVASCTTAPDPITLANNSFLEDNNGETFRVVMMSDAYLVSQKYSTNNLSRGEDESGDQYIMERLKKMDVIDSEREGHVKVWVYPDSGRLMKVRFLESTYIQELDKLIIDDIQRWEFQYAGSIYPRIFSVRYRIVLRKTLSDEEAADVIDKMEKD